MSNSALIVVLLLGFWMIGSIPSYMVGSQLGVSNPGQAFIPGFGPYIVLLRSIKRSGWLCLLVLIPVVSLVFAIWLSFMIPTEHRRTRWWALAFLVPVVNLIAFYAYAFTLDPYGTPAQRGGGLGSTYHVPPGGDWRRH